MRGTIVGDMLHCGLLECFESTSGERMFLEDFNRCVPDGKALNGALAGEELPGGQIKSLRLSEREDETGSGQQNDADEAVVFARYHDDSGAGQKRPQSHALSTQDKRRNEAGAA